jgi:hypothetical protein
MVGYNGSYIQVNATVRCWPREFASEGRPRSLFLVLSRTLGVKLSPLRARGVRGRYATQLLVFEWNYSTFRGV